MRAWYFAPENKRLSHSDNRMIRRGRWLVNRGELHASIRIIDALHYGNGPIICRVELDGKIIKDKDKIVAERMKCLWYIDGTELLNKFARMCALDVIHLWDAPNIVIEYLQTGNESLRIEIKTTALEASRTIMADFRNGIICNDAIEEMDKDSMAEAAWAAARAAWGDMSSDVAWETARATMRAFDRAAARDAVRDFAQKAAKKVTRDCADIVVTDLSSEKARDIAWDAASLARADISASQNRRLLRMVKKYRGMV